MQRGYKLISCEVMRREFEWAAPRALRPIAMEWLPRGLHDLPAEGLRAEIQRSVDRVDPALHEAVLLGYGLCNNALAGLRAGEIPLVMPRAHDCITLFLGDAGRYREEFTNHPGTYYLTRGWIEFEAIEKSLADQTIHHTLGLDLTEKELIAKYGEDNARYLMETLNGTSHYSRMAFINTEGESDTDFEAQARRRAEENGWRFAKLRGDMRLIHALLNGPPWSERDFLTVPPGGTIRASTDDQVVHCPHTHH